MWAFLEHSVELTKYVFRIKRRCMCRNDASQISSDIYENMHKQKLYSAVVKHPAYCLQLCVHLSSQPIMNYAVGE